jgi:hypothetical protein
MREVGIEYPLDTYNELSKPQQIIFTFLLKHRNIDNQKRIKNIEIAESLNTYPQHVSANLKAIIKLDMIRRGKHDLVMINPNMWFFGDGQSHDRAIKKWNSLQ